MNILPIALLYQLFITPTFYHSVAHDCFDIDADTTDVAGAMVRDALLNVYMLRPELIETTDGQLSQAGVLRHDLDEPPSDRLRLVDMVPKMDEPVFEEMPIVELHRPKYWTFRGEQSMQFMQNWVSDNWHKGGEKNYSMLGQATYEANYDNYRGIQADNKLEMKIGLQTSPSDTVHTFKTNADLLRYTGKIGLRAAKNWYYTIQLLAYTQFTQGLKSNKEDVYSDFMSPFNLNVGLGMDYKIKGLKGRLTGSVNMSVFSFNFRYVDRKKLAKGFGVIGDHHTLEEFGSQLTANVEWQICPMVKWKSRLYGFTTYHNSLVEWENTFNIAVGRYITAQLFLYPRIDDSTKKKDYKLKYLQFNEYSSLGVTYSF